MRHARIDYYAENGYHGVLYYWHKNEFTGKWNYSLSVRAPDGHEVLHSYNASAKNLEDLKFVMSHIGV